MRSSPSKARQLTRTTARRTPSRREFLASGSGGLWLRFTFGRLARRPANAGAVEFLTEPCGNAEIRNLETSIKGFHADDDRSPNPLPAMPITSRHRAIR